MSEVNSISSVDLNNGYNVKNNKNANTSSSDFSSYLGETKSLDDIFDEAAQKYNISENLLKAIGKAESNFDANAVSRCGAQGIMQLMPSTATSLGVTDSFDAEQNIMGGAKYIAGLLKKYDGDTSLALAAYNAGSGNVAKYGGIPPFEETQNYVVKVTKYMNQGVDTGNTTVQTSTTPPSTTAAAAITTPVITSTNSLTRVGDINIETKEDLEQELNNLFSYDDYLKLLDQFFEDEKSEDLNEDSAYYASKQINYNVPVMNLMKGSTGI